MKRHIAPTAAALLRTACQYLAASALLFSLPAHADGYPAQPIRLVVTVAPGGSTDTLARMLGAHLGKAWGKAVVVYNRPGGAGLIGAEEVARAKPDGYTLLLSSPSIASLKTLMKNPPLDVQRDFVPIKQLVENPFRLAVTAALPIKSVADLVAYAKTGPTRLNFAVYGATSELMAQDFNQTAGIEILPVQYRGEAPGVQALAAGDVQVILASRVALQPLADKGYVRILAVTSKNRLPDWPDTPTVREGGGPEFELNSWTGLLAPSGTPEEICQKIAKEVDVFLAKPEIIATLREQDRIPVMASSEEFATLLREEGERWAAVARRAGMEPQ